VDYEFVWYPQRGQYQGVHLASRQCRKYETVLMNETLSSLATFIYF